MINPRKIATLGIGFDLRSQASIGFTVDDIINNQECGTICCSIIIGKFSLGCAPITAPFSLSFGCAPIVVPPQPPSGGGGGGGPYPVNSSHINYHTPRTYTRKFKEKNVIITIKFADGNKWQTMYNVSQKPSTYKVNLVTPFTLVKDKISISIKTIKPVTRTITTNFKKPDK